TALQGQILQFQDRLARLAPSAHGLAEFTTDHALGDLAHGQVPDRIAGDRAAVPHDRDGVGDAEQLVQAVGDVDDADTAGGQSPDHTEEDFDLGIGQDGA